MCPVGGRCRRRKRDSERSTTPSERVGERECTESMYVGGRTAVERARGIDSNQTRWKDIVAARDGRRKGGRIKRQGCSWREDKSRGNSRLESVSESVESVCRKRRM